MGLHHAITVICQACPTSSPCGHGLCVVAVQSLIQAVGVQSRALASPGSKVPRLWVALLLIVRHAGPTPRLHCVASGPGPRHSCAESWTGPVSVQSLDLAGPGPHYHCRTSARAWATLTLCRAWATQSLCRAYNWLGLNHATSVQSLECRACSTLSLCRTTVRAWATLSLCRTTVRACAML